MNMEKILQYAWKWRLFGGEDQHLADGRRLRIIDPGELNTADGPDFFNAKIKIDGCEWAGNVELHMRASDWWRHGHHLDPAYSSIILHVVAVDDARLSDAAGREIPQFLFPLSPEIYELYARLSADASVPPPVRCWHKLHELPRLIVADAVASAAYERLYAKAAHILENVSKLGGDMAHAGLVAVARALGFGKNSDVFEQTAMRLNLNHCSRHADDQMQLDAMLFGTAGLLNKNPSVCDDYFDVLYSEFIFLAHKYGLRPVPAVSWKRSGMRPANFPHRRLAYLSRLIPGATTLLSRIKECGTNVDALTQLFTIEFTGYWACHYSFGTPSQRDTSAALGESSIHLVIINAVAPLMFAAGLAEGNVELTEAAVDLLEKLAPENNVYIRDWARAGIRPDSAFTSQGLIQLRKIYCGRNECLRCRIGNRLMRSQALPALPVMP